MRICSCKLSAAICGVAGAALSSLPVPVLAETMPLAETADFEYAADTTHSPYAVKTAGELDEITGGTWKVTWRAGDTVTMTAPDGTVSTLVSDAASDGSAVLSLAGGVSTLENSAQGVAVFSVRRSLDGTLGDGTMQSPAKLVDGDELVDYNAGSGYVFTLESVDGLLSTLSLPAGCCIEEVGGGIWRLASSADGCLYVCAGVTYLADSEKPGPDRKTTSAKALPVAYSGDNWAGNASKAATLTFTSPNGAVTELELDGSGASPFKFKTGGEWNVRLAMEDGDTLEAVITIGGGLSIFIR